MVEPGCPFGNLTLRERITPNIAKKPSEQSMNTTHVSVRAMITPPMAGMIMRQDCQIMELRATALIISRRSISAGKKACRVGHSRPEMRACRAAIVRTCHTLTVSVRSRMASNSNKLAVSSEVTMMISRLSSLSAMAPPNSETTMVGIDALAPR